MPSGSILLLYRVLPSQNFPSSQHVYSVKSWFEKCSEMCKNESQQSKYTVTKYDAAEVSTEFMPIEGVTFQLPCIL